MDDASERTKEKTLPICIDRVLMLAEWTGLEPATPGVTGRYSNQLNYHSRYDAIGCIDIICEQVLLQAIGSMQNRDAAKPCQTWRPLGDSNPCSHRERVVS